MSAVPKVIDLPSIVEPHLNGGKILSYNSRYLTKPGENYGSLMLSITANVQQTDKQVEELSLVAKLPPITNDLYWKLFQPERTCVTENSVYKYLAPALRELQLEAGLEESQLFDGFSKYYGSRISLNPNATVVDRDAVLVQENLQTSGYRAGNRLIAYDRKHTEFILEYIAKYHALPIALRLKKPQYFDKYVRPYFKRYDMNAGISPDDLERIFDESMETIQLATNNNDLDLERAKELWENNGKWLKSPETEDALYATLSHGDIWINNIMIQYDKDMQPKRLKIVDFQIAQYDSIAHDVVFFLLSSVDVNIVEEHFEELLKFYYEAFIKCLKSVNVATEEYSYKSFLKEIWRVAPLQLPHAIFMTKVILADNRTIPDSYEKINLSVLSKNTGVEEITKKTGDIIRLAQKFKFYF